MAKLLPDFQRRPRSCYRVEHRRLPRSQRYDVIYFKAGALTKNSLQNQERWSTVALSGMMARRCQWWVVLAIFFCEEWLEVHRGGTRVAQKRKKKRCACYRVASPVETNAETVKSLYESYKLNKLKSCAACASKILNTRKVM
jgi:hypothetical protein